MLGNHERDVALPLAGLREVGGFAKRGADLTALADRGEIEDR
jgi:hypothetical protein